jgi:hypothetical protein
MLRRRLYITFLIIVVILVMIVVAVTEVQSPAGETPEDVTGTAAFDQTAATVPGESSTAAALPTGTPTPTRTPTPITTPTAEQMDDPFAPTLTFAAMTAESLAATRSAAGG